MSLATPSNLGAGDYSWRFSLGRTGVPIANWAAMGIPVSGGFGAALTRAGAAPEAPPDQPRGAFDGGDSGFGGGGLSGGKSGSQAGPSTTAAGFTGQPDFTPGNTISTIGKGLGLVAAPLGIGTVVSGIGALANIETANAALTGRGFAPVNNWDAFVDFISGGLSGQSAEGQYTAAQGFGLGAAVEYDDMLEGAIASGALDPNPSWGPVGTMGFDDSYGDGFGGWGGYGGAANQGAGADIESDPTSNGWGGWDDDWGSFDDAMAGAAEAQAADAAMEAANAQDIAENNAAVDDENNDDLSGPSSGDPDDEAAGENDMGQDDY